MKCFKYKKHQIQTGRIFVFSPFEKKKAPKVNLSECDGQLRLYIFNFLKFNAIF